MGLYVRAQTASSILRPQADQSRVLSLQVDGVPPEVGTKVHLAVHDGWRIPHSDDSDDFIDEPD